jgi:hypothetical protein
LRNLPHPHRLRPIGSRPVKERAHDLVLPRGSRIDRRYGTTVYATVPLAPEDLANWLRQECDDAEPIVGPTVTIFPSVHVRTAETGHKLRVEIAPGSRSDESSLIVDALQEQVPPTPMSNEEAMKKAGLTPDGKWLDPKHLE